LYSFIVRLFESPECGNSFVEQGEQCDCGLKHMCTNPCCNPDTCMFYENATCATGECCDLNVNWNFLLLILINIQYLIVKI